MVGTTEEKEHFLPTSHRNICFSNKVVPAPSTIQIERDSEVNRWTYTLYIPESICDTALVDLTAVTLRIDPGGPQFHAVYSLCRGPGCRGGMTTYHRASFSDGVSPLSNANIPHHLLFFCLFHSQEALTVFKEAIQKMPRQFAPQSLYNMMGKSCFCFRSTNIKAAFLRPGQMTDSGNDGNESSYLEYFGAFGSYAICISFAERTCLSVSRIT